MVTPAARKMTDDTKLPLTSDNPTEALLAQLREQAPHVFSEGKVDWDKCRRAFKSDHPCALNFDQGLRPPV